MYSAYDEFVFPRDKRDVTTAKGVNNEASRVKFGTMCTEGGE